MNLVLGNHIPPPERCTQIVAIVGMALVMRPTHLDGSLAITWTVKEKILLIVDLHCTFRKVYVDCTHCQDGICRTYNMGMHNGGGVYKSIIYKIRTSTYQQENNTLTQLINY